LTLNDGSLHLWTRSRLSFIEKIQTVYELRRGDLPPPVKHSPFWRQMVYQIGSLSIKQNAPGRNYFTPMAGGLQWKSQARLSSY